MLDSVSLDDDRGTFDPSLDTGNSDPVARRANSGSSANTEKLAACYWKPGSVVGLQLQQLHWTRALEQASAVDRANAAAGDMGSCVAVDMESWDSDSSMNCSQTPGISVVCCNCRKTRQGSQESLSWYSLALEPLDPLPRSQALLSSYL